MEQNELTERIIGAAIEVHRELGSGLLESAYQRALAHEFTLRGIPFEKELICPVLYKDLVIDDAYRLISWSTGRWWLNSKPLMS